MTMLSTAPLFYEGQIAQGYTYEVMTGINAETSTIIPFGRAVVQSAPSGYVTNRGLLLPVDANSVFLGIAVKTDTLEKRTGYTLDADDNMGWPFDSPMGYLVKGVIGVRVRQAVTVDDPVFWIHTPAIGEFKGEFRIDANTAAAVEVPRARWLTDAAEDGIAALALNLFP